MPNQKIELINAIAVARGTEEPTNKDVLWLDKSLVGGFYNRLKSYNYDNEKWELISRSNSELLSDLKTVDGVGSGLDSDTLQGYTPEQLITSGGSGLPPMSTGKIIVGQGDTIGQAKTLGGIATIDANGSMAYVANSISHTGLTDIGTNTHVQIDSHIADSAIHLSTAQSTKLAGIEAGATTDQTDAEIEAAYNNQVPEVTQSDAEAGTVTTVKRWTPQRVKQAIDALSGGGTDANAVHVNVGAEIAAITAKATPTTSDIILIEDAADLNKKKKITIGDLPSSGGNTIYTANGTLSGARTVDLNGNTLNFGTGKINLGNANLNGVFAMGIRSQTPLVLRDSSNVKLVSFAFDGNRFAQKTRFGEDSAPSGIVDVLGADTLSTSSSLKIYDGDSTPNLLWDFNNDGTLTGNKSKTKLIAQNSTTNSDADFIFRCRKSNDAIDFLFVGNGGEVRLGTSATNTSTGDKSTHILWAGDIVTQAGASNYSILMGHLVSANYNGESVIGLGKSITINGQRQYGIGDNITLGGQNAVGIGRNLSMSSGANVSIGLDNTQNNAYGVLLGLNLETNANGASIIGRGTNSSSKVVNNTANSLALGWETTTPQHLFKSTGVNLTLPTSSSGLSSGDLYNDGGTVKIV